MAICSNCGTILADGTKFCTNCGAPVAAASVDAQPIDVTPAEQPYTPPSYEQPAAYQPVQQPYEQPAAYQPPSDAQQPYQQASYQAPFDGQQQGYQQPAPTTMYGQPASQPSAAADTGSIGWGVLGAFFPIVGLILFLVWRNTKPQSAKVAGIGAIIGFALGVLMQIMVN